MNKKKIFLAYILFSVFSAFFKEFYIFFLFKKNFYLFCLRNFLFSKILYLLCNLGLKSAIKFNKTVILYSAQT